MTAITGIYGAGGCGRGIMPLARRSADLTEEALVFIDDAAENCGTINGHEVLSFQSFLSRPETHKQVAIAIADTRLRHRLYDQVQAAGLPIATIWSDQHCIMDDVLVGEGALISPFVTLTSNIRIGRCFHANLYSYVEHDCVIGDFVTFAPGVKCNGNVKIGDHAYVGSGAVIRQDLTIGAGATVGMGAVVTKDVPPGATVIGNPARNMEKSYNA